MSINYKPLLGDQIKVKGRTAKVTKILPPKPPSPGGLVVENEHSIFFVAPWEKVESVIELSLEL